MMRLFKTICFSLMLFGGFLMGCGQKGPLYMEQPPVANESAANKAEPIQKPCPTKRCQATPANSDTTEN